MNLTQKRIVNTGKTQKILTPEEIAEALSAEPVTEEDLRDNPRLRNMFRARPPFLSPAGSAKNKNQK